MKHKTCKTMKAKTFKILDTVCTALGSIKFSKKETYTKEDGTEVTIEETMLNPLAISLDIIGIVGMVALFFMKTKKN